MRRAVLLALLALAAPVSADDWSGGVYSELPLDFSLRFARHELDLAGDGARDTTVDRVGIGWRERYADNLVLGLFLDYVALTQENEPLTAGRELTGYHAGVSLDADLLRFGPGALFLRAGLGYLRVDDDTPTQAVVISWTEPSLRLGVRGPIAGGLRAYGGVRYGTLDGEERLSGTVDETRSLEEDDRVGGFVGLELALEPGGYVGLSAETGPDRTVGIYFGRTF